ncbi:MAG: glycerol-3-phosphate dehydrogenase/oxidase [Desulfobacula sp.]|mgnify:CR=1 FL=1|nr:glycerol-3-phosphate dehydrogenase/oxidase [Desulfobacula sp.]MBT7260880.1 glycerol-3-phosphate dehydrogenase/oxidase [Desulfobacula sp.]
MRLIDAAKPFDLVVIGGGVTGAGVFHEAVNKGLKTILLEAKDFSWGTSSRSSKMVHGGLRYLKQGKFLLTRSAVRERERLLKTYPGLVNPLNFLMPIYKDHGPSKSSMKIGLSIYSFLAGQKQHQSFTKNQTLEFIPQIRKDNLVSSVGFKDAQVDDARLVLRLINDGCLAGGVALNYTKVIGIERDKKGHVAAINALDTQTGHTAELKTKAVINATGAWAEQFHPSPEKRHHLRPLRGSHLIFPKSILPLDRVISFAHPNDLRPAFMFPWNGCNILGTTEVDHENNLDKEPFVTEDEASYLIDGLQFILPGLDITLKNCVASIAGIRPILSKKKKKASKESREHVVWEDKGLVTVTGGKLTTFRILALDALNAAKKYLPKHLETKHLKTKSGKKAPKPDMTPDMNPEMNLDFPNISENIRQRLYGRYGQMAGEILKNNDDKSFSPIANTSSLWVEISHAAQHENIHNLSDLMLRRVRIGLFLPHGGKAYLDKIEKICKPFLSWDQERWANEKTIYINLWQKYYSPPNGRK